MSYIPTFCKNCGSRKVRWDQYFDDKGIKRYTLTDALTERPHRETCPSAPQRKVK